MERVSGWVEEGGISVVITGTQGSGTQRFQQSFRGATVTVYESGTTTLATIYSDNSVPPTSLANPFTADATTGRWSFLTLDGVYDIQFSGGGITAPFSITAMHIGNPSGTDVREFGAVGDGITDDTAAFTLAVNSLPSTGGTIIIPRGSYALKNWTISDDGVNIQGAGAGFAAVGYGTRLCPTDDAASTDEVLKISGVATFGVNVRDVFFDNIANDGSAKSDAMVATNGTGWRFQTCRFAAATASGVLFSSVVDGVVADSTDAGGFFGCSFYSGGISIASAHTRVDSCYFNGNDKVTAITVQGIAAGTATTGTTISNNRIETYTGVTTGVIELGPTGLAGLLSTLVTGNDVSMSVGSAGLGILVSQNCQGMVITNNSITELGSATRGLRVVDADGCTITGNRFSGQTTPIELTVSSGGGPNNGVNVSNNRDATVLFNTWTSDNFILVGGRDNGTLQRNGIRLTTADATPIQMYDYTLAANEGAQVDATILAQRDSNGDPNGYVRMATFRHNAGAAALVGSVTAVHTAEHTAAWDATMNASSNDFEVTVTGGAYDVNWILNINILRLPDST